MIPVYVEESDKPVAWIPEPCEHHDTVPVEAVVTGEVVAHLCVGCDTQLPPDWRMTPR